MPTEQRHSVQVEIKRGIYMDEHSFEKSDGFESLQQDIERFLKSLAQYVQTKMEKVAT